MCDSLKAVVLFSRILLTQRFKSAWSNSEPGNGWIYCHYQCCPLLVFPISWNEFLRSTLHAPRVELFLVTGRFHPREKRHKRSPRRGGGNKKIVFDLWILIYSVGKINCAKNLTPLPVLFKNFDACAEQLFFKNICQLLLLTFFWKIWNLRKTWKQN